jgi:hypothetical protein
MPSGTWATNGNANTAPPTDFLGTPDNRPLVIKTSNAERVRIDASGRVGVGTSSPGHSLHLALANGLRIEGGTDASDANDYFSFGGNGSFGIDAPGVPDGRFIVHNSGNVGIGTALPEAPLHLAGGNWDLGSTEGDLKIGNDAMRIKVGVALGGSGAGDGYIRAVGGTNRLMIGSGTDNSLTIANGNVGIGNIAPTERLSVNGNVQVTGDVLLTGADCAEQFDAAAGQSPDPGTVVVIDQEGALRESQDAYDKKVAGVVSGAGDYRHALVLDRRPLEEGRIPVALMGKVYCKVDAEYGPIEVGDLLTTSATPGHAMRVGEFVNASGSVIGKALRSLEAGRGLIPILIALQ